MYADVLYLIDVELIDNHTVADGAVSVADLHAVRTSFVGNTASLLVGTGGAVNAVGAVVLENVTFHGDSAKRGGAVHMGLPDGTSGAELDATFVTFLDNGPGEVTGGADLHLSGAAVDMPVELRGVLFGGVGTGPLPNGLTCAGTRFAGESVLALTWTTSFATDASYGGPEALAIALPTFTTVPFLTGATALPVPEGDWAGLDTIDCAAGWPDGDKRGAERPQGEEGLCDAGAVVRVSAAGDNPPQDEPARHVHSENDSASGAAVPPGPIPTSIPAAGEAALTGARRPSAGDQSVPLEEFERE